MFGIQSWIALPQEHEEMAPLFEHFDAAVLPAIEDRGVRARVIAGSAFGQKSPVGMVSEWFYAEVLLEAGASAPLDADHEERAIYVTEGEVDIAGDKFAAPQLLIFRPGDRITVTATQAGAADVPRRRGARRPALSVVEFRLLAQGAHRGGERGVEERPLRADPRRREGVHSAAGALAFEGLIRGQFRAVISNKTGIVIQSGIGSVNDSAPLRSQRCWLLAWKSSIRSNAAPSSMAACRWPRPARC